MNRYECPPDPCPACGCPEARVVARGTRWGQPWARFRCRLCGHVWIHTQPPRVPGATAETGGEVLPAGNVEPANRTDPAADAGEDADGHAVPFYVLRCPACTSTNTRTTSTRRPVRYHRCRDCGHTFKSVERSP